MSWLELVEAAEQVVAQAVAAGARLDPSRITGIGWATVEADRAFVELSGLLGPPDGWIPQERDALLGASVWRRDPAPAGSGMALFVIEPDTEGRLAANLARFGEGVGAVYLSGRGERDRLVAVNARWGPYVIVRSRSG